jgi:hypothetical protein
LYVGTLGGTDEAVCGGRDDTKGFADADLLKPLADVNPAAAAAACDPTMRLGRGLLRLSRTGSRCGGAAVLR